MMDRWPLCFLLRADGDGVPKITVQEAILYRYRLSEKNNYTFFELKKY